MFSFLVEIFLKINHSADCSIILLDVLLCIIEKKKNSILIVL